MNGVPGTGVASSGQGEGRPSPSGSRDTRPGARDLGAGVRNHLANPAVAPQVRPPRHPKPVR